MAWSRRMSVFCVGGALLAGSIARGQASRLIGEATTQPTTQPSSILTPATRPASTQPAMSPSPNQATLVTLDVKDAKPEAVVAELIRQTSFPLAPYEPNLWTQPGNQKITISATNQPFWTVFREFCRQSGLTLYPGYGDRRLLLMPEARMGQNIISRPASVHGACMIIITGLQRTNTVDLAQPDKINRTMYVSMQVYMEPGVKITGYSYNPDMEQAVDENGNSLLSTANRQPVAMARGVSQRNMPWYVSLPLGYPQKNAGEKIVRLRGKVRCMVQTRCETLEIKDAVKVRNLEKTVAGRRMLIKEVKKNGDRFYQVGVTFYRDGKDPAQFNELANNPGLRLVDEKSGREYSYNGMASSSNNGNEFQATLSFYYRELGAVAGPLPAEDLKLVWEVPTESKEEAIPFEFTDLPMP